MRWIWGAAVAACAVALPGIAVAQSGQPAQPAQGQSGQMTSSDSTGRMSDSTGHKRHRHHHHAASTGDVSSDSAKNQTQSGMKDASGTSTMGHRVKKVTPTQGQPVTAKGDTLQRANDSTAMPTKTTPNSSPNASANPSTSDSSGMPSKMAPNGSPSPSPSDSSHTQSKMAPNDSTKSGQPK